MSRVVRVDGKEIAANVVRQIAESPSLTTRELIGFVASDDAAGMSFQKMKQRTAAACGIRYRIEQIGGDVTQELLAEKVRDAASREEVGGIVVQLPLPAHLDAPAILDLIPAEKDPDVLGAPAYASFLAGFGILPPAAETVRLILTSQSVPVQQQTFAVIGQGNLVGKPVADWLEVRGARVQRLDRGFDESLLGGADCAIVGTGAYTLRPGLLKSGAGVIDFGYQDGRGDLDVTSREALAHLAFYTPTPGGTGPVLIAALLQNFAKLTA